MAEIAHKRNYFTKIKEKNIKKSCGVIEEDNGNLLGTAFFLILFTITILINMGNVKTVLSQRSRRVKNTVDCCFFI